MWRALPGLFFLLVVVVLFVVLYLRTTNTAQTVGLVGQKAPIINVAKLEGYNAPSSSRHILFNQQYVLVNFFASWCTPCLAEHPYLNQLAGEYDVAIVGVAWRDSPDNVRKMLEEHGNPYRYVGMDRMDATAYSYGVEGLPESFLVGPDGLVVATHRGPLVPDVIQEKILPHIQ